MEYKRKRRRSLLAFLVFGTLLPNSFAVKAQESVSTSEDLTSASSVFFIRKKTPQARSAYKNKATQRSLAQKSESRKYIQAQIAANQKARQRNTAVAAGGVKTATPDEKMSKTFAAGGEVRLDENNIDEAIKLFEKAVEFDSKNNTAKLGLSDAYVRKGDQVLNSDKPETAIFYYEKALKANPANPGAYAGLGECYDASGNNDKAQENYEKALALDPGLTALYAPLGILYFQKGEIAKAENYLSKIRAVRPNDPETEYFYGLILSKQNRNEEAIAAFERSIAKDPTPEAHLYLGEVYDRLDRDKEAVAQYQEALRLNPRYAEAHYNLGVAYFNRGKYLDAVAAYEAAIKIKIDYGEARANLAETYRQLGLEEKKDARLRQDWFNKAVTAYGIATSFVKNDPNLYSNYGVVLAILRKWTPAIEALKKSITPKSDAIDYTTLGVAYYFAADEDAQRGRVAAMQKNTAEAQAAAASRQQKLQEARTALEKAVALDDKFAQAHLQLGITRSDLGDNEGSIRTLQTALKLNKDWPIALNEMGATYFKMQKYDEAADHFKKATEVDKQYMRGFSNLAKAEFKRGRVKEAKKAQDKVRELDPREAQKLDLYFKGIEIY